MTVVISFKRIHVEVPVQNSGIFVGDISLPGFDASQKVNTGHAAVMGHSNVEVSTWNVSDDQGEIVDGVIFDQDVKWNRSDG